VRTRITSAEGKCTVPFGAEYKEAVGRAWEKSLLLEIFGGFKSRTAVGGGSVPGKRRKGH